MPKAKSFKPEVTGPFRVTHAINAFTLAIDDEPGEQGERDYNLCQVTHGDPEELAHLAALFAASADMRTALRAAERLLDSVAFVSQPGDTDRPLKMIRAALLKSVTPYTEGAAPAESVQDWADCFDATPTWAGVLPILILGLTDGNEEAKGHVKKELARMAKLADKFVKSTK